MKNKFLTSFFVVAEYLFQWTSDCSLDIPPFRCGKPRVTEMIGALLVFLNSCQSMKRMFRLKKDPCNAIEIINMCLPWVGDFLAAEERPNSEYLNPEPTCMLSPTLLQNLSYFVLHVLLPTK